MFVKQHPAGVSEQHQSTQSQETLSNISIVSSVMRNEETKVKTQGRKNIGFILASWCWYGCQHFLEFVHTRKCDLYKLLLILSQWQWLIVFSPQNVSSANKPEFFPFRATIPPIPGEDCYERKLKLRGSSVKVHTTTICEPINPIKFLYYYLLAQQHFASAKWGTSVLGLCMDDWKGFLILKNLVPNELCLG